MQQLDETKSFTKKATPEKASVLLVHGLTANPSELLSLGESLHKNGYSVHAPLLSGHGKTVEQLKSVTSDDWIVDVKAALQSLLKEDRSQNIFIVGMSFGSLLSLVAADKIFNKENKNLLKGIVLLASPFSLSSSYKSFALKILSFLPDFILNMLGTVAKKGGREDKFSLERISTKRHSIAAGARLFQVRRKAREALCRVTAPALAIQDPRDHHLLPKALEKIKRFYGGKDLNAIYLEGAEHELTLGPKYKEVEKIILDFLEDKLDNK